MIKKNIYITPQQQIDELKKISQKTKLSFSDLVKQAIDEFIEKQKTLKLKETSNWILPNRDELLFQIYKQSRH